MSISRPRPQRGDFPPGTRQYGSSELGAPLLWFPAPQADSRSGLIIAGTHGDENSSIVTLSCALRTLKPELRRHHVVLTVNPDGCQLGLRANAAALTSTVTFQQPTGSKGKRFTGWNSAAAERDVVLLTGEQPGSERETEALCQLIHQIHPAWVVSFHDPLAVSKIRATAAGSLAGRRSPCRWWAAVATTRRAPLAAGGADIDVPCITAEFPPVSADEATERYLPAMTDLLRWQA